MSDIDTTIAAVESKARGRTRYADQPPFQDEVLVAEIYRLRARVAELESALRDIHDDCVEYARINNLFDGQGRPGSNHAMRRARAVLAKATSQDAGGE